MTLYDKILNNIPIKTVGIWKNQSWMKYNLQATFEQIGELYYVCVPADRIKDHTFFTNKIYSAVEQIKPDLVFSFVNSRHAVAEPYLKIKHSGIPVINIFLDDVHKFKLIKGIAHAFSLNISTTKLFLSEYKKYNAQAIYLPEGSNIIDFTCLHLKKDIDVSFVGNRYGNRPFIMQALKNKGYIVKFCGKGWPGGRISFEQMIQIYNRSKIVVGVSRVSSNSKIFGIKGRDFEVPPCGSFYLCEDNPELHEWFTEGKEIIFWKDIPDLVKKAEYYLKNDVLREKIAKNALDRVRAEHTWVHRLTSAFKRLKELEGK